MNPTPFITPFAGRHPRLDPAAWVDISARLIGRVSLAAGVTVWPGAVLRADEEEISIGEGSAVLDLCLLEAPAGKPVIVEPGALISHQATLHGATVKAGALVGIGAIVLDGAVVGEGALLGAGALLPPGMVAPPGWLMLGQPARPVRELTPAERGQVAGQLEELSRKARQYCAGRGGTSARARARASPTGKSGINPALFIVPSRMIGVGLASLLLARSLLGHLQKRA